MTEFESIMSEAQGLLDEPEPSLVELRSALLDLDEAINSPGYIGLSFEEQSNLQNLRKELQARVEAQEADGEKSPDTPADEPIQPRTSSTSAHTP